MLARIIIRILEKQKELQDLKINIPVFNQNKILEKKRLYNKND